MCASRMIRLCLLLLAVAQCPSVFAAEPEVEGDTLTEDFFPMEVGDRWVYAYGDGEVVFDVLDVKMLDKGPLFSVRRTIGEASVEFQVSIRKDGVYIHQEGKKRFQPPLRQFAFDTKAGDKWAWKGTYGGVEREEAIENLGVVEETVPAGRYPAIVVMQENLISSDQACFSLAIGVGVVSLSGKTELIPNASGEKFSFHWRLKRFERGEE